MKVRQEKQTKHLSYLSPCSVIYLHVQAQCHCDQSDQTDKMQVIKLLSNPVIS